MYIPSEESVQFDFREETASPGPAHLQNFVYVPLLHLPVRTVLGTERPRMS
jgi:hypothetical protein